MITINIKNKMNQLKKRALVTIIIISAFIKMSYAQNEPRQAINI
jgi:hypothetical protein